LSEHRLGYSRTPTIAVFQPDSTASARLRDALSPDYDLQAVGTWSELSRVVRTARISACIVDIYGPGRTISPDRVGQLRKRHPDLAIVVYSDFSKNRLDPFELGRRGVDAVIDAGADDPTTIRDAVSRSYASATAGAVANHLAGRVPDLLVAAVQWAVESAGGKPRAGDLAAALGMSRAEMARKLGCLGAPPARVLLVWGRLLYAARLLDWGKSIESSAHQSGYASGSGLHRAFSRRVGFPPGEVPDRGRLTPTLSALLASARINGFR